MNIEKKLLVSRRILRSIVLFFTITPGQSLCWVFFCVAVRRISYICYACFRRLDYPFNIRQDNYNQVLYKGENQQSFSGLSQGLTKIGRFFIVMRLENNIELPTLI